MPAASAPPDAHRPFVGQLGRHRVAEQPSALAGHQERDVDPLLDVAARLGQDLAHLARHGPGETFLVLRHEGAEAVQDLAALGRRRRLPGWQGSVRGADRHRDVRSRACLEAAHDVSDFGRIHTLERGPGNAVDPAAGDEQLVRGGRAAVPDIGTSSRDQRGMEIDSMPAARCSGVADDASTGVPGVGRAAARDRRFRRRARGRDPPRPCSCQCRRLSQTRSKAMATDLPPPRHSVAMPYRPPRRCSSWSSVATIRAPDAPIG